MDFRTPVHIAEQEPKIDYSSKILLLGSCFAENIGKKLEYYKLQNSINPFGILYHPLAIEKLLCHSVNNFEYSEKDIFYRNERWHCFDAHSRLSNPDKSGLLNSLNLNLKTTRNFVNSATHIIITLGTARVYRQKANLEIVANCHKIPQKEFSKELLSVNDVKNSLLNIISEVQKVNPTLTIIFTVSPVRHLRDGLVENQSSKSVLFAALEEVKKEESVFYFPAYEIMMDELRDYRFYADDMMHPSELAVNYIWEKFRSCWFANAALPVLNEIESIQKGLAHLPFNENSEEYIKFRKKLKFRIASLKSKLPYLEF